MELLGLETTCHAALRLAHLFLTANTFSSTSARVWVFLRPHRPPAAHRALIVTDGRRRALAATQGQRCAGTCSTTAGPEHRSLGT